jgi:DNA polymerase-3 subunit epsilon
MIKDNIKGIVFDVETNGFSGSSVLSISAIKFEFKNQIITELSKETRYYFRDKDEKLNEDAVNINGLTDSIIKEKRGDVTYAEHFVEDDFWIDFFKDVDVLIAHNVKFDMSFLYFIDEINPNVKYSCTMLANVHIVKEPDRRVYGKFKWPTLEKTALFHGLEFNKEDAHSSDYDVKKTFEIIKQMQHNYPHDFYKVIRIQAILGE